MLQAKELCILFWADRIKFFFSFWAMNLSNFEFLEGSSLTLKLIQLDPVKAWKSYTMVASPSLSIPPNKINKASTRIIPQSCNPKNINRFDTLVMDSRHLTVIDCGMRDCEVFPSMLITKPDTIIFHFMVLGILEETDDKELIFIAQDFYYLEEICQAACGIVEEVMLDCVFLEDFVGLGGAGGGVQFVYWNFVWIFRLVKIWGWLVIYLLQDLVVVWTIKLFCYRSILFSIFHNSAFKVLLLLLLLLE